MSLVPSLTESLFDLGLGNTLVGISDFCIYPAGEVDRFPRVGGPKDARLQDILDLKPDLVITNQEENPKELVDALQLAGVPVWVTFPKTVQQSIDLLWDMLRFFQNEDAADRISTIEITLNWELSSLEEMPFQQYFCPIWQESHPCGWQWYMTFNQDTYAADLLRLLGGKNVFAGRSRRYPLDADLGLCEVEDAGERDTRYPRVRAEEVIAAAPEYIFLLSEPFPYTAEHIEQFASTFSATPAARNQRILPLDGTLVTWYGTRLARALTELPQLFAQ